LNESVILKLPSSLVKALGSRWVWVRGKRYLVMKKLDPVKVAWVIKEKEKGTSDNAIASVIKVSGRCIMRRKSSGSNFGITDNSLLHFFHNTLKPVQ
jgi:hypothetical protein